MGLNNLRNSPTEAQDLEVDAARADALDVGDAKKEMEPQIPATTDARITPERKPFKKAHKDVSVGDGRRAWSRYTDPTTWEAYELRLPILLGTFHNQANAGLAEAYAQRLRTRGHSPCTILAATYAVRLLDHITDGYALDQAGAPHFNAWGRHVHSQLSRSTAYLQSIYLRGFYAHLTGQTPPPQAKLFSVKSPPRAAPPTDPSQLPPPEDLEKMFFSCKGRQEQATFAYLVESGARPTAVARLLRNRIQLDRDPRRGGHAEYPKDAPGLKRPLNPVHVFDSTAYLRLAWADKAHVLDAEPHALLLWGGAPGRGLGYRRLTQHRINSFLKTLCRRANLPRVWNATSIRHAAATRDAARGMVEAELRHKYSWTWTSRMPQYYVALAAQDMAGLDYVRRGLTPKADRWRTGFPTQTCPRCGAYCAWDLDRCDLCTEGLSGEPSPRPTPPPPPPSTPPPASLAAPPPFPQLPLGWR